MTTGGLKRIDIVLAEALDRISRDQADVATLFKYLRFAGVTIVTWAEGKISELHVGLKGTPRAGCQRNNGHKARYGPWVISYRTDRRVVGVPTAPALFG